MDSGSLQAATTGPVQRKSQFWIEDFTDLTFGAQSPLIFRKWAAAATIAGALERKVWLKAFKRTLYPNLYILLTGGPGIGKTDALREVHKFWDGLPDLCVAPSSVSRASLVDSLNEAERSVFRPTDANPYTKFNSLQIGATEFGTFLSAYDTEFLSTLNDLYDCVKYKEMKRHMKHPIEMPHPQLNLIAGTTPAWLGGTLPETAWAEGFSSRLILIYSGERIKVANPFADDDRDEELEANLQSDLQDIHRMFGQFVFAPEVRDAFVEGYQRDFQPQPEHPKLEHYLPRRHIHLLKLTMVMSAARSNDMVLRIPDYQRALDMLFEAESYMPDVFRAMKAIGTDSNVMDEAWQFIHQTFVKENRPVPEHRIVHFLSQRLPGHSVIRVLEVMTQANMIQVASIGTAPGGRNAYKPTPRGEF